MPNTVSNQRTAKIHREKPLSDFLQIKKDNLFDAYRLLNATGLVAYLYFASNKDGFELAVSPAAIRNITGMPESTCRDQIKKLINMRFLVPKKEGSNVYDFYERPQPREEKREEQKEEQKEETEPSNFKF